MINSDERKKIADSWFSYLQTQICKEFEFFEKGKKKFKKREWSKKNKKVTINYLPSWCLIDWTDKVETIRKWFLPEALKNHKVFKEYVVKNLRKKFKNKIKKTQNNELLKTTYKIKKQISIVFDCDDKNLQKYGLISISRTGAVAMTRGSEVFK